MMRPGTSSALSGLTTTETETTDSSSGSTDIGISINDSATNKNGGVPDDVAQVYILQPTEILKNIDLMRTVAMLLENRLQGSDKSLDEEKLKDLYGDVERFPEAFQKFISIIHQVQYLNVTSDWQYAENGEIAAAAASVKRDSILKRLFNPGRHAGSPAVSEIKARKEVMLGLLSTLQQVFNRYMKLQAALEERTKKFHELLRGKVEAKPYSNDTADSDEDDPNMPLLMQSSRRGHARLWLERMDTLQETLRKTKRSTAEVQDSVDVLRDLIKWDYKQIVSPPNVTPWPRPPSSNFGASESFRSNQTSGQVQGYNSIGNVQTPRVQMNHEVVRLQPSPVEPRQRMWVVTAVISGVIVLLVVVAALSFLRFSY